MLTLPSSSGAAPASGDAPSARRAKELAREALAAYRNGQYERSIEGYKEAYDLLSEARYLFALGLSYLKLSRWGPALSHFQRFKRESAAPEGATLKKLAAKHIGEILRTTSLVTLEVAPAGARVLVDSLPPLTAPVTEPLRLRNGQHRVRVTLAGYAPLEQGFGVGSGVPDRMQLRLLPMDATGPEPPAVRPRVRVLQVVGWSGVGLAAASVAVAGALGALSVKARKNVEDPVPGTMWEPGLADDYANAGRYGTGAWVAGSLGAAFLVAGVTLLVLDGKSRRERRAWFLPSVGPGRLSLGLGLEL